MAHGEGTTGSTLPLHVLRILIPWVGLIIVVMVVWSLLGDYRTAVSPEEETSTPTVEATATAGIPAGEPYVRVLSDGLNLRSEPSTTAGIVGVLNAEQQLILLEEGTGWYRIRTTEGVEGWVAAGGRYTELVQP